MPQSTRIRVVLPGAGPTGDQDVGPGVNERLDEGGHRLGHDLLLNVVGEIADPAFVPGSEPTP